MTPRRLAVLAALSGAVILAGWVVVEIMDPDPTEADTDSGVTVAAKGSHLGPPRTAIANDRVPVADAAIVDADLLNPRPLLPAGSPAVRLTSLQTPDQIHRFVDDATGSLRSSPAIVAVRKAISVPRLDKDGTFTLAHIAQIKASLDLTPDQERHWAPIEAELREIARQLAAQKASGKKVAITASDAQRLYWAAGPLILSMTEDQKQQIRRIARAMGLEQVASLI